MSEGAVLAAGIDLGGTKIETAAFGAGWAVAESRRRPTPATYEALLDALAEEAAWAREGRPDLPVGVAAAGLVEPGSGRTLAANLPSSGRTLPADLRERVGRLAWINDCHAFALAEATLGAGRGLGCVLGLAIGTGIAAGAVIDGRLRRGPSGTGGEIGHAGLPAHLLARHGLPLLPCPCGRTGCVETLASGPGLLRVARAMGVEAASPEAVVAARRDAAARAWEAWCEILAETILSATFALDPDAVVLGGGLARVPGIAGDVAAALTRAQLKGFAAPRLLVAEGEGATARGAALMAWQESRDDRAGLMTGQESRDD
jgi:N-acetylglucosamine kinase